MMLRTIHASGTIIFCYYYPEGIILNLYFGILPPRKSEEFTFGDLVLP